MDLVEIVALDFLLEDATYVFQGGEPFESTGADDPILQPTIGALDLALGLRRKGVGHIHTQQAHDLTPLRIDVIRSQDLLVPDAVPALDEAEDAQIIHVVLQRQSIGLHQALCGPDMGPGGLLGYEISIEQQAAVVIDGGDQGPFLRSKR